MWSTSTLWLPAKRLRHALRINTRPPDSLQLGDIVEAAGFFQLNHHRSEMHEAVFRRIGRTAAPAFVEITREQAFVREPRAMYSLPQDYDDYLVALRGRLVSVDRKNGEVLRLNLECDGVLVPAEFTVAQDVGFVAGNLLLLAQEGITNALKHARPVQIDITLRFSERAVTLIIHDDGAGFDPATAEGPQNGHFGLQGRRERIKRLGGQLESRSACGAGTTIRASVPQ